jgi:RsiW-degrading membrane proteinase PrsW (M82 family)
MVSDFVTHLFNFLSASGASAVEAYTQSPMFAFEAFVYAVLGGLFPALIWLWFWMHEHHDHHEPRNTIWLTFLVGMGAVFIVYPFQRIATYFTGDEGAWNTILAWAVIEEVAKYLVAYYIALRLKYDIFDEPIDAFVYLMTAALGFSAMENTLFLIGPVLQGETISTILTGNMRFMGANLLHVASSGVLSLFISFTYFRPVWMQKISLLVGLATASVVHAVFNFVVYIVSDYNNEMILLAFSYVWITLIILILALEKVKTIKEF